MKIKKQLIISDNPITDYLPKIEQIDLYPTMYLISNLSNRFLEHKLDSNCISIDKDMKYDLYGQYRWRTKIYNNNEHIFNQLFTERIQGNSHQKITNGYEPTKLLIDSYLKWLEKNPRYDLIEINDINIKVKGIEMIDNVETRSDFYEEIEINVEPIKDYFNEIMKSNIITHNDLTQKILPTHSFYNYIVENDNKLKIHYKQVNSGRYYSVGQYSIHSLKKEVRNVILNDYHEYDISVSSPLLLSQIYKEISGDTKVFETISYFIKNKKRIREIFSEKYNITLEQSKTFFTSLFFGSRLQENDFYYHSSVTRTLDKDVVNYILSDTTSYEYLLYQDVKKLFKVISEHYKKIDKTKVIGYNNHTLELEKWKSESVVSHLYQSLESVILESMIKFYTQTTNDYNYVRVHDCLYTKQEISEYDLYHFIKKDTTFDTLFKDPTSKQSSDLEIYQRMNMK